MEQSWYVWFMLLMPENVMNTGFRNSSLAGTLPYRLFGDCVKACNTVTTLSLLAELRNCEIFQIGSWYFAHFHHCQINHITL
jgi:hypothetical protein